MKSYWNLSPQGIVRATWLVTFTVFVGVGIGLVWWPSSQTIDAYRQAAGAYYEEASRNEQDVRHAAQLRTLQDRVIADLKSLAPLHSTTAATATMLQLLAAETKNYNVSVRTIVPAVAQASPAPQALPSTGPFDQTNIEIDLSGRFDNILRFVSDLPRHDALLEIRDVSLSQSGGRGLSATLHATLYRYHGGLPSEDGNHVSSSV
jgi:Tfp pilus assembly protein PilO